MFVAEDGSSDQGGLHVLDLSALDAPVEVEHYYAGESSVHDVYVRDGLAFVSHWDAGLVILDVGNGIAGGSPSNLVEVSRIDLDGETHNAWYWPEAELVFVGEEDFQVPGEPEGEHGRVHVVDVRELENPAEIATLSPPDGIAPHNFWLDEEGAILYVGWYQRGVVAIDVSGPLAGDLATQGRELAVARPAGPLGDSNFWAVQLHRGRLYGADTVHGIWVFDPMP